MTDRQKAATAPPDPATAKAPVSAGAPVDAAPSLTPTVFSVLTAQQMRACEQVAVQAGTPLIVLMERAGLAVAETVMARYTKRPTIVLCGPGNNGGDGFVAARHLSAKGWPVRILLYGKLEDLTAEAKVAASRWRGTVMTASTAVVENAIQKGAQLVVDALYGIGLRRPIVGEVASIMQAVNRSGLPVVSIDIPSGINADSGQVFGQAMVADQTVCFFRKKLGHVLMPGRMLAGEVVLVDIGIPSESLQTITLQVSENHPDLWLTHFPQPQLNMNKYDRGHVLVLGGAELTGASRLAAQAAQRIGAGLVTIAAPQSAFMIYAASLASIMVRTVDEDENFTASFQALLQDKRRNVALLGPGAGDNAVAIKAAVQLALTEGKNCVIDADAISAFAGDAAALKALIHPQCILTPHDGEFARLFDKIIDPKLDKISRAKAAAAYMGCPVLLKGADTVIATAEGIAIVNTNAPATLSTAGAGDVLAGFIAGLMAQGTDAFIAGCIGAWLHGAVAAEFGPCLIAEDLITGLPNVLKPRDPAASPQPR